MRVVLALDGGCWGHLVVCQGYLFHKMLQDVWGVLFGRLAPEHEVRSGMFRFDCQMNTQAFLAFSVLLLSLLLIMADVNGYHLLPWNPVDAVEVHKVTCLLDHYPWSVSLRDYLVSHHLQRFRLMHEIIPHNAYVRLKVCQTQR